MMTGKLNLDNEINNQPSSLQQHTTTYLHLSIMKLLEHELFAY